MNFHVRHKSLRILLILSSYFHILKIPKSFKPLYNGSIFFFNRACAAAHRAHAQFWRCRAEVDLAPSRGWTRDAMAEAGGEVVAASPSGAASGLSNGAGGASAQTSNPLSRKLHKILETRLDNDKVIGLAGWQTACGAEPGRGRGLGGSGSLAPCPTAEGPQPRARLPGGGGDPGHYSYLQKFQWWSPRSLRRVRGPSRRGGGQGPGQDKGVRDGWE